MAKAKEKVVEGEVGSPQPDELTDDPMTEKVPAVVPANLPAKVDSEEVTKLKLFIADETEKRKLLIDYIRSQLSNTIDYGSIHVKKDCPAYKNGEE